MPPRSRFQFTLRTLVLASLFASGCLFGLVYPFERIVAYEWEIEILSSETPTPIAGQDVVEYWHTLESPSAEASTSRKTDSKGIVTFAAQTCRMSVIKSWINNVNPFLDKKYWCLVNDITNKSHYISPERPTGDVYRKVDRNALFEVGSQQVNGRHKTLIYTNMLKQ